MNPDPMEVQEPPPHRNEKTIFEMCREARNFRTNARRCGTLLQPYEFSCPQTAELGFKNGYIYYSSKAIKFAADIEQGFDSEELQKRAATFWVLNEVPFGQLNPLGLNPSVDVGIVKTYGVAYNTLIGKTIIALARSQQSVLSWIANPNNSIFVRDQLRNSIRSLYVALERLWDKQWTVDNVEDIGTYAINENMIQIMPFRVRGRTLDDEMTPRQGLQLLIQTNILQHWPDDIELAHFSAFLINPNINIRKQDVLDHPFLVTVPHVRESKYKRLYEKGIFFTDDQIDWLDKHIFLQGWQLNVQDPSLTAILDHQIEVTGGVGFAQTVFGALHFAKVVIAHYHQYDVNRRPLLDDDLRHLLQGLLTGVYGARFNEEFIALA
ncbi:uncharacterized protein LOC119365813 [Triticum dicoccoides]|uniref:uncharacterized protein LOC119365813 n=1 Tax=Triticum dicoccoides TaxID=85692 RepID=UPI0018909029|nr:uncharacterized protein LOC119365813 [Triticum dicoccoides]